MLNPACILFLLINFTGIKPNQEFIQNKIRKKYKESTPQTDKVQESTLQTDRIKGKTRKAIKYKVVGLQTKVYSSWAWSHST